MTQEQIQQLHAAVHKAVIVEGKAKTWHAVVISRDNVPRYATIDISEPKEAALQGLTGLLRQHGISQVVSQEDTIYGEWSHAE